MVTPYLRLAVTRFPTNVVPDDGGTDSKIETQVYQRRCLRCRRWFWAWSPERRKCFPCAPLAPEQLQRILGEIQGNGIPVAPKLAEASPRNADSVVQTHLANYERSVTANRVLSPCSADRVVSAGELA